LIVDNADPDQDQRVTPEVLVDAIKTVAAGGAYLYAPLAAALSASNRQAAWREEAFEIPHELTERETDVLKLMTSGISNREIAKALRISDGTVRNHVSSIFSKLGVNDRTNRSVCATEAPGVIPVRSNVADDRRAVSLSPGRSPFLYPDWDVRTIPRGQRPANHTCRC